jgi:hypothetical protein
LEKLHEGGIIGRLLQNYLGDVVKPNCETNLFAAISYENIFTAFFIIALGIIGAVFAFLFEKFKSLRKF